MMIQGEAVRDGQTVMCDIALNEIAVTRKDALKAVSYTHLDVYKRQARA